MFVTKKYHEREVKRLEDRIEWWVNHYRELRSEIWKTQQAHQRLLEHFNLQDTKINEHHRIETRTK